MPLITSTNYITVPYNDTLAKIATSNLSVGMADSSLKSDKLDGKHSNAFSDTGHIHDTRYYRKGEVDTALAGKLNISDTSVFARDGQVMDSSAGAARLGGKPKAYYDTVGNGARDSLLALKLGLHAIADSAATNVTGNYYPLSNGSRYINGALRETSSGGYLASGTTPATNILLYLYREITNAKRYGLYDVIWTRGTTNGTYGAEGVTSIVYANIDSGVIDGGAYYGMSGQCYNYGKGSVKYIRGLDYNCGSYGETSGSITSAVNCINLNIYAQGTGYIDTIAAINIKPIVGTKTINKLYSIFSRLNAPSKFIGSIQSGLNADSTKIDSTRILFDGSASVEYDGTNMVFDSRVSGTGNYQFKSGTIKLGNVPNAATVDSVMVMKNGIASYITIAQLKTLLGI
jgi:hypothetical protein